MKKLLSLALLSTLICFSVQAEEGVYSDSEITNYGRDETLICDLYGNLLDGVVKEYREDGTLWYETPYKNGQIDGVEKWYREDGTTLDKEIHYDKNGKIIKEVKY